MKPTEFYIGLMSGTSADGIDAALVYFDDQKPHLSDTLYVPYPPPLRDKILNLYEKGENEIERLGQLDVELGKAFADTTLTLLRKNKLSKSRIKAIGSHGQTIRHYPYQPHPFSLQIADPNIIATQTGITTVADFRRKDIAVGGQGAPLVPAFHAHLFQHPTIPRAIINIGGIANITLLPTSGAVLGFDSGPGNALLDAWIMKWQNQPYDEKGKWATQGTVQPDLLASLQRDSYFQLDPPKSTGREYFNLRWLNQHLKNDVSPVDVQATLIAFTVQTIFLALKKYMQTGELILCGGGVHNDTLIQALRMAVQPNFNVVTTEKYQLKPDWVEAIAFAWMAEQTLKQKPSNLPAVTGANKSVILGGIYFP